MMKRAMISHNYEFRQLLFIVDSEFASFLIVEETLLEIRFMYVILKS